MINRGTKSVTSCVGWVKLPFKSIINTFNKKVFNYKCMTQGPKLKGALCNFFMGL